MNDDQQPLIHLLDNNRAWVASVNAEDPNFFERLAKQQAPEYLWIGCSDSRVPANQITGLAPGEVFVHRNIANVVVHSDLNCLSVLQFAIEVLKVRHIMVVGHYGCGGVGAALDGARLGLVDNWLRHVRDVHERHAAQIDGLASREARHDRLCELNVIEQVVNICHTTVLRDAWARQQPVTVHGWVYGLRDGLVRDLRMSVNSAEALPHVYARCVAAFSDSLGAGQPGAYRA
ncbi:carbonate dehydratase [Pandoraea terrae]|uniref:Carbonic anhydrase n=1 Tax=Pandoraea terrae TaxID=1537710 RepID=A0A5E4V7T9_9BURK|nr:carbonate dehydratase [Pandoraea terrae]